MNRSFNLIDNPWIPVVDYGYVSLHTLFKNPKLRALGGTALEKIALTKLLLAIAQAAITPRDNTAAQAIGASGVAAASLSYLTAWHHMFNLYGTQPFLQFPQVSVAELKSYGTLLPDVATGNTTCLTQYQMEKKLDDAQRALLLVVQMSLALGGKKTDNSVILTQNYQGKTNAKGKAATSKPGPAIDYLGLLHSFAMGQTLHETLWLNLATEQDIDDIGIFREGLGVAPWEKMPIGEDCDTAKQLKHTLMGRLVPLCRFCLLTDGGVHITEGIQHLNYKESIYDPSITLIPKGQEQRALWCDPDKPAWRELPALLGGIIGQQQQGQCYQLKIAYLRAKAAKSRLVIWSGGVKVSSNAGEQYLSGRDDMMESTLALSLTQLQSTHWVECVMREMQWLDILAKRLFSAVTSYFEMLKAEARSFASRALYYFWQLCDLEIQNLLNHCDSPPYLHKLKYRYVNYLIQCYADICPNQTARQLNVWMQCYPFIHDLLNKEV